MEVELGTGTPHFSTGSQERALLRISSGLTAGSSGPLCDLNMGLWEKVLGRAMWVSMEMNPPGVPRSPLIRNRSEREGRGLQSELWWHTPQAPSSVQIAGISEEQRSRGRPRGGGGRADWTTRARYLGIFQEWALGKSQMFSCN